MNLGQALTSLEDLIFLFLFGVEFASIVRFRKNEIGRAGRLLAGDTNSFGNARGFVISHVR